MLQAGGGARDGGRDCVDARHVHLEGGGDAARRLQQHDARAVVRKQQLHALSGSTRASALLRACMEHPLLRNMHPWCGNAF